MGQYDEPLGHGEVSPDRRPACRVDNIIAGPGRAFEIAQGRPRPRPRPPLHAPDRPRREGARAGLRRAPPAGWRSAQPIINLGGNRERIAKARIAINPARLLVLHAAWKLDTVGIEGALSEVSEIKAAVPRMALRGHRHRDPAARRAGHERRLPARRRLCRRPLACAWPTARTRCTSVWWPGTCCVRCRSRGAAPSRLAGGHPMSSRRAGHRRRLAAWASRSPS